RGLTALATGESAPSRSTLRATPPTEPSATKSSAGTTAPGTAESRSAAERESQLKADLKRLAQGARAANIAEALIHLVEKLVCIGIKPSDCEQRRVRTKRGTPAVEVIPMEQLIQPAKQIRGDGGNRETLIQSPEAGPVVELQIHRHLPRSAAAVAGGDAPFLR